MTLNSQEVQSILSRQVDFSKKAIAYQPPDIRQDIESFTVPLITHKTSFDIQKKYLKVVREWFSSNNNTLITGLDQFPYMYVTAGTFQLIFDMSTFIDSEIVFHQDDFPGYHLLRLPFSTFKTKYEKKKNQYFLCSYPFNGGVLKKDVLSLIEDHPNVILDGAFFGTVKDFKMHLNDNIKMFAYSFSKMFGLQYYRIGVVFSKIPSLQYEVQKKYAYHNAYAQLLITYLLKKYDSSAVIDRIYPIQQQICAKNNILPGECIWSAYNQKGDKTSLFSLYENFYSEK